MVAALYTLYYINSAFLILVVLLQSGRGGGLGEFGGGGGASTTFGARGASNILQKLTVYSATAFMVLSITLAIISARSKDAGRGEIVAEEQMNPALQDGQGDDAPLMINNQEAPAPLDSDTDDAPATETTPENDEDAE